MRKQDSSSKPPPETHVVDVDHAMKTLDHVEMVALAEMYERWIVTEDKIRDDQRTKLVQWASDYERIAAFCGESWKASEPEDPPGVIAFLAQSEARARGLY